MAVRYFEEGDSLFKKRNRRKGTSDNDDDIRLAMNIENVRQASELAQISQAFADNTALSIASRLSATSKLSNNIAQQASAGTVVTNQLSTFTAQAVTSVEEVATASENITTLAKTMAYWPLYTDGPEYLYEDRYRDYGPYSITLTISGVEEINNQGQGILFFTTGNHFFATSSAVSGIIGLYDVGVNSNPQFLYNSTPGDAAYLTLSNTDPISVDFLYKSVYATDDDGYIVGFGDQYKVQLIGSGVGKGFRMHINNSISSVIPCPEDDIFWGYYAFSYDPLERSITGYKNGISVFTDVDIDAPGSPPSTDRIEIFKGLNGQLANLRLFKSTLSNTTVQTVYQGYRTRFIDFDSGNIYQYNDTSSEKSVLIDVETGDSKLSNISRMIANNTALFDFTSLDAVYNPGDTSRYNPASFATEAAENWPAIWNLDTNDPTASSSNLTNWIYTSFVKLNNEDYLRFFGAWVESGMALYDGTPATDKVYVELITRRSYPYITDGELITSGVFTYGSNFPKGVIDMSHDISSYPTGRIYHCYIRGRYENTDATKKGFLVDYNLFTLTSNGENRLTS